MPAIEEKYATCRCKIFQTRGDQAVVALYEVAKQWMLTNPDAEVVDTCLHTKLDGPQVEATELRLYYQRV